MSETSALPRVQVRRDRSKPIIQQHPWIFSGAITHVDGDPQPGDIVRVESADGQYLATGYWNQRSQIQVRILTWRDESIDDAWWIAHIARAVAARHQDARIASGALDAYRVINAESDYLPGLIVDRYAGHLVLQALTYAIDARKAAIADALVQAFATHGVSIASVYERSDIDVRRKEGLREVTGSLIGETPAHVEVREGDAVFTVNLHTGHKTGFYLDQRENRMLAARLVQQHPWGHPPRILNLFSYTGGFGAAIAAAGPPAGTQITHVDASADVLALAERNLARNSTAPDTVTSEYVQADAFDLLRHYDGEHRRFDVIVCDPPKFAHNDRQVERAARGYKDLNLHAFRLLHGGGYLLTFSCSGAITADLFQKIVFGALADAGRQAQILAHLEAGSDHPVALTFPEGVYLKGLLLRVY